MNFAALQTVAAIAMAATVLGAAACGGGSRGSNSSHDGGSAGRDGPLDGPVQCPIEGGVTSEPPPRQAAFDGGVPIDQIAYALAVVRCGYLSRCLALSPYLANQCVDSVASTETWTYPEECGTNAVGRFCVSSGLSYATPSPALLQAAMTGTLHYDARQAAECVAALSNEGCAGYELIEDLPACANVFTCAANGDGGPPDGGGADGGSACEQLLPATSQPFHTCSSDGDCAGVTGYPRGPDCVAGICAASRCGITVNPCTSFAAAGESCNSNALSLLNALEPTTPGGTCAFGLACHGQTADGGVGTCAVPVDVGGPCADDTNCKLGLTCACGTCEIPPSAGACVNGRCRVGVAYCDSASNTCRPVRSSGASCADAFDSCGPGLFCTGAICGGGG